MHRPTLTVVVTSYNYSRFISSCIESVLGQSYTDFELIILDNDSTDDTVDVVSKYLSDARVSLVRHERNVGAYLNFNMALRVGVGRYLAIVSADDYLLPGHFSGLIASLQKSSAVLAYSPIMLVDKENKLHGVQQHPGYAVASYQGGRDDFSGLLAYDCYVTLCAVIFDRDRMGDELYFDVDSWSGSDWEIFVRLALKYRDFAFELTPTACYRIHDAQYSSTDFYSSLEPLYTHISILERYIDHLLVRGGSSYIRMVANTLRQRMGRYERSRYEHVEVRLKNLLNKLEGRDVLSSVSGALLIVINAASESDILQQVESLSRVIGKGWECVVVGGKASLTAEAQARICMGVARDVSFVLNDVPLALIQLNAHISESKSECVLYLDANCTFDMGMFVAVLERLQSAPHELICFGTEDSAQIFVPAHWQEGLAAGGVLFRKSMHQRVGGFSPVMCFGAMLCDFIIHVLRFNAIDDTLCRSLTPDAKAARRALDVLGELPWAQLVFSNTVCFEPEDIMRAADILLHKSNSWLHAIDHALELQPSCSAAHFMRALVPQAKRTEDDFLFSIILTTYNRPELLKDALASVGKQTLRDFEVILVNDNGSPVESLIGGYDFSITYIRQGRNQGPAAARNAALRLARGRYVVYLDDDDLFLSNHLQTLAQGIEVHPGDVVYTDAVFIAEKLDNDVRQQLSEERRYEHVEFSRERLFVDNYIPVNTFAWPRAIAPDVGEFDEALSGLEDWDFLMRLAARVPFHHVVGETVQVRMRVSEGAADRRSQQAFKDYPALYRELYSRHSDLGEANVRQWRSAKLKQLGLSPKLSPAEQVRAWLEARRPTPLQRGLIEERLQAHQGGPRIGVLVLDMTGDADAIARTVASLQGDQQGYANVAIRVLSIGVFAPDRFAADNLPSVTRIAPDDHVESLNAAVAELDCEWCLLTRAGETFTASGLLITAVELIGAPACRAVYADEMQRSASGDPEPVLRPDFNLDLLLSFPASMARHWLFRRDVLIEAGGFDGRYKGALEFELVLRLIEQGGGAGLGHVSEPLIMGEALLLRDNPDEHKAIERHLMARGYAQPVVESFQPGRYRLRYGHAEQPVVSILIPARSPLSTLQRCLESLLETNRYANYEILLLEMVEQESEVQAWLKALQGMDESTLRVLDYPGILTLGAVLNRAVQDARGEYLLFLDPDTAFVQEDWLDGLLNHAQRPEVGIVGAKLLGPEGHIRHAGLILGLGGAVGSSFVGEALGSSGYMHRLEVDQNYSAVSADCLMINRSVFEQVGGWDESESAARWADVDLCLKAREAGYLTVWSPHVRLMKQGMRERLSTDEQDALFSRWLPILARDPAYNPGFSLQAEPGFELAAVALAWRPLQAWRPLPTVLAHPADLAGCGQYRVIQPFNALQQQGFIEGALSFGMLSVADLERYDPDVVLLQRQIGDERLEAMRRMQAFSRAFKVYELDDYLPNLPMKSAYRAHMPKDILRSLRRGISYMDRFVVSTEAMAEAFQDFHPDIRIVENRLDPRQWHGLTSQRRCSSKPRVGWAGGAGHTGDLEMLTDVVKELAGEVDWVFFGMCPDKLRPYIHEFHPGVPIERYPAALAGLNLDLALAPVEQNLFNECKSNLRLLEYGACGFPVICSDVRCYRDALPVTRVKNRFKDWLDAIRLHLADLDAAARMGDELRAAVRNEWMLEGKNLEAWRKAWLPD